MQSNSKKSSTPRRRGFTLVEILIVVGIIVILASIGIAIGVAVKRQSAEKQTRTTMETLRGLMSTYLGSHPDPGSANWFQALRAEPDTAKGLASLPGMTKSPPEVDDGYGNGIQYFPPAAGKAGYFWSYGADGVANTTDDVFSTPVSQ
ncbi:MAG TPA: prepilin-type N-terminal cleavage/methylation domain-containing protein [Phycisphaerae bacterium]|jgi:prepilin-type N-terminal cleavage/methylation domain-containing protein